ncbi:MAG: sigma-70 family RNA polymerase sigma factor [Nannocystaceae bacterium]
MGDDRELLLAWRSGDPKAGRQLVERHYPTIERFFFNKVGDRAADLIQLSFLRVLEARARVRADADFRAYLLGIARNVLYEYYRSVRKDLGRLDFGTLSVVDVGPTPSSRLVKEQQARMLLGALQRIPIDYQIVLELYYWESMRSREVAAVLEIPEGTARSRIRRAKQLLEEQLAELTHDPTVLDELVTNLEQWAAHLKQHVDAQH